MTNPFMIILALALWELIKYTSRNLHYLAQDAYRVKFSRYEAVKELHAFRRAPSVNKIGFVFPAKKERMLCGSIW